MTSDAHSQQSPLVFATTTVTIDVNLDMICLVHPQISATSPEAPQVVGSTLHLEEFTEPVYNQVYQEQIVAGEMTQNIIENSVVQEQVIVPAIPLVVEQIQEQIVETIDVTPQGFQIPLNTSSTSTSSSSTSCSSDRRLDEVARMLVSCIKGCVIVLLRNAVDEHGTPRCRGSCKM